MIRFYSPADAVAVKALYEKQGLEVHLPLPGEDPAVLVAVVDEEEGQVRRAVIFRMTVEAHYICDPDSDGEAWRLIELAKVAHGALLQRAKDFRDLKWGSIEDVIAEIPNSLPRMKALAEHLGFEPELEAPDFTLYYRRLDKGWKERRNGQKSSAEGG